MEPTSSGMTTSRRDRRRLAGLRHPVPVLRPGYAGLGYYAVYYQGGESQREEGDTSSRGFDQRNAQYAKGRALGRPGSRPAGAGGGRWQGRRPGKATDGRMTVSARR